MTRDKLLKYVRSLDEETQRMFFLAEDVMNILCDHDTMCDEYQLAASVYDVFVKRAEERDE
jgi:hypothetical protein